MIKGTNIYLRALEPSDLDLLYSWENDQAVWPVSNTVTPFAKHVLNQYIATAHLDIYTTKQLRLVICLADHRAIGCIDIFDFEPNHGRAGVGILIGDASDRKSGYASEALGLLIDYCFNTLHLSQLYCNILTDNEPSLQLFRKFGFEVSGTKKAWTRVNGEWKDEYFLQLFAAKP